ncbi:MRN complex-interacting protein isoform X2 [Ranitomeya variabilis]|uniref:MRN complex-interacting protein isoform X2 n=1 Tax=Ranitomeya variabilis TaxID=490064 RepID=UPI004056F663
MVQEFQVLRCCSCRVFQVHQVKKSTKWCCKLCGEKQSVLRVYGQGSGADCRHHVQKLNLLQGQVERAVTGTDGGICPSSVSDEDTGGESHPSPIASQEAAPVSRWNKYLEENNEEEQGGSNTEQEHYYSHQDRPPTTVRKRLHSPYHEGDFYKENKNENISKKKKIYKVGDKRSNKTSENSLETDRFSCRTSEDMGCLKWQDRPTSHALPLHISSETFLLMNTSEGRSKQSTYSAASILKREPKMDPDFNPFDRSKMNGPDRFRTSSQCVLPNNEPTVTHRLSAQVSSPGSSLCRADVQAGGSLTASSLQKPSILSHLFQTDDDFDDDY